MSEQRARSGATAWKAIAMTLALSACGGSSGARDDDGGPRGAIDGGRRDASVSVTEAGPSADEDSGTTAHPEDSAAPRPDAPRPIGAVGCDTEHGLGARADVVFCEPWETESWWREPYPWIKSARVTPREEDEATAEDVSQTSIETDESRCVSGRCLRVHTAAGDVTGVAIHWPLASVGIRPDHLFARYYLRLGPEWTPDICDESGEAYAAGGKFPGLADVRVNDDPEAPDGQCGNGGAAGDGLHCWSHRTLFRGCSTGSDGVSACSAVPGAVTRFGSYLYYGNGEDSYYQIDAPWDSDWWGQNGEMGGCETDPADAYCTVPAEDRGTSSSDPNNTAHPYGVLVQDRWYAIEIEIGMNTVGEEDGIIRGWIDGELAYEKTNMVFRAEGHDGLHVRTFWLNVHHGGDFPSGSCRDNDVWIDQLVLATDAPIGLL